MITIIDDFNSGVERFIRDKKEVVDSKQGIKKIGKTDAVILCGVDPKNGEKIIQELSTPCLALENAATVLAEVFDGQTTEKKKDKRAVSVKKASPLLLGLKKKFIVMGGDGAIKDLPEDFEVIANSPNGIEVFQHIEFPIFGTSFKPDGVEGKKIINNFIKFLEVWEKYHK